MISFSIFLYQVGKHAMLHIIILKGFIFFIQKMGQNWLICPQSREVSLEVGLWLVWQQQRLGPAQTHARHHHDVCG